MKNNTFDNKHIIHLYLIYLNDKRYFKLKVLLDGLYKTGYSYYKNDKNPINDNGSKSENYYQPFPMRLSKLWFILIGGVYTIYRINYLYCTYNYSNR